MARLARGTSCRAASDGSRLASSRLSPVLDVEEPTSHGAAGRANRCPRIDSRDVHSKSTLGHTSDSRRAPQVGDLRKSVDGRDVHAAASAAAVPNVADLPHQSCEPDHGCRPVRRAHRDVPAAFCPYDPCARPSSDRPRGDQGSSDRGLDGTTAAQCISENDAPRYLLHDRDSVFADVATTIAGMNTHAVRTAPRSPRQNAYVERVIGSIRRECLDHVIVMNAAGLQQILRDSRLTRTRRARARSRRRQPVASSPFQKSAGCITVTTASPRSHDAASIQLKPTVPPVRSTRLCCGALLTMSETLEHWSGVRRGLTRGLWALLFSFRLFSRHTT